jgi:hypothetical protein
MRILGFILAIFIGFVSWGLTLALSGGAAPLGRTGPTEGLIFFVPVLLFAGPVAVLAFLRGNSLTGTWLVAVAPILGAANFSMSMSAVIRPGGPGGPSGEPPPTFALAWCVLLLFALAVFAIRQRQEQTRPS